MGNHRLLVAIEVDPVGSLNRRVQRFVGATQVPWHPLGIVKIGYRFAGMLRTHIENRLGSSLYLFANIFGNQVINRLLLV